jgi:hypothetical protein
VRLAGNAEHEFFHFARSLEFCSSPKLRNKLRKAKSFGGFLPFRWTVFPSEGFDLLLAGPHSSPAIFCFWGLGRHKTEMLQKPGAEERNIFRKAKPTQIRRTN